MGDVIRRKITILTSAVMGVLSLIAALLCCVMIRDKLSTVNENRIRCDANMLAADIENDNYSTDTDLSYAVVSSNGTVTFQKNMHLNKSVNLHTLGSSGQKLYTVPLVRDGVQFATLAVDISTGRYTAGFVQLLPVLLLTLLILAGSFTAFFIILNTLKNDIFAPVKQLHTSTKSILSGNTGNEVRYDYDGEIGTLCHDFELMRAQLRDSFEREERMKSDEKLLMASISHDLKTPLATVQGYLESICLDIVIGDQAKQYAIRALDKTMLLSKMTNDILEHSKAELNQLSINPEEVYSGRFFGEMLEGLASDAKTNGFTLTYSDIPDIIISLDRMRISQVMENLIGNAVKYGHKNGSINVDFSLEDNFLHVSVRDNGPGIPAVDLPFIFDKFYRGDKARTMNVPGSGLGLSIVRYIVSQHGGSIECDSVLGEGTCFEFCLKI
ncbi:MAG: HAMP domain-containing sensor histidine kinase [Oscillospiraceae bacterium]|nr:HAMP domain-containing sensor histidine kinase [Oscillospiraceae bacterium]